MLIIGLTGGIGCGKTTVSQLFEKRNIPIIDADEISRTIVKARQPALTLLVDAFGNNILLGDGSLNKDFLRELVFSQPDKKKKLEDILHPIIYKTMFQQLEQFTSPYGIFSIPLLFETQYQDKVDRVLVIDCSEETQKTRVKARDQLDDSMIQSIMHAQCSRSFRLSHADDILSNDGNLIALDETVQQLHELYLKMSAGKNSSHPAK
ncbi:MAG: dephospho-CoA kinase [Cycloclasticus sp. symbiont of Bathymodiolus heckerae]|nr:MAG: dephospho-CoA kinase [Cycloclasticus sp. symbiont of Bathymodiolus heckerae]